MPYLPFIDDVTFRSLVLETLSQGRKAKDKARTDFNRNIIDPFSILWEIASFDSDFDKWYESELVRQAQKTLANHIGMFHQNLLGSITGWENLGVGNQVDLVNHEKKIIAEIKNKHNTITGGKLVDLYKELEGLVMPKSNIYKDYTAYYVEIIPKRPVRYNIPFTPSDKKTATKCTANEQIRKIDGASFYALVTGHDDALQKVFSAIPKVIKAQYSRFDIEAQEKALDYFEKAYS